MRAWCSNCVQSTRRGEIQKCGGYLVLATGKPCPFYEYRLGGKRVKLNAFRQACLLCMGGSPSLVRECEANCLLHPFRMGKNPNIRGASKERMRAIRPKEGGISTGFSKNEALYARKASAGKKEP
ncbi:MAG: hypothetical protein A4E73_00203 [Syntrophaceae bacterium PtaU1.Bin231]|nr:MAG: hypothetical protein A4E73_00203 [Syntrophaceae bacterium PtaU1.Bin231]